MVDLILSAEGPKNLTSQQDQLVEYFVAKFGTRNESETSVTAEEIEIFIPSPATNHYEATSAVQNQHYPCPDVPIVTVEHGGRLGNKIWEYAAVWCLSRLMGRPGFVPISLLSTLSTVFNDLSLPAIEEIEHCGLELDRKPVTLQQLMPLTELIHRYRGRNLLLPKYIVFLEPIFLYRDLLRDELSFKTEILRQVQETIDQVGGSRKTLVGVHVRRTDFKEFLPRAFNSSLADEDYYKKAMNWYRVNLKGPILFLVVSDDVPWCKKNLLSKDVRIVSKSPEHDLALLCRSDHTIIDYGTFGYWGALMSKGHTVSLGVHKYFSHRMAKQANWTIF
ncbi:galactoside 2-alpha-L-fucosyltransferase SEC1-like [Neocloeon triangulifer]|uniref:galactoside 2-alpha-L-fucosyltransferase SEC1-like n=1 Tax=Neocloeon triangulifer TaxID=2078957 RepID=UPI00286F7918|nr:galactoside 2-alpha-L-fucosyltransferase SEC1-like [Neocloeon triangulifer]